MYGASGFGKDLKSIFQGQVDRDYFPVQFEDMRAKVEFVVLTPEPVQVENLSVTWEYTQHPQATIGYKVEVGGKKVGYASDDEFLIGYHGAPQAITLDSEWMTPHRRLAEFLSDVDLLVHEAQYTNLEYGAKVRWGHSSVSNACVLAKLARARRWLVTHHDPLHEDAFLDGSSMSRARFCGRSNIRWNWGIASTGWWNISEAGARARTVDGHRDGCISIAPACRTSPPPPFSRA